MCPGIRLVPVKGLLPQPCYRLIVGVGQALADTVEGVGGGAAEALLTNDGEVDAPAGGDSTRLVSSLGGLAQWASTSAVFGKIRFLLRGIFCQECWQPSTAAGGEGRPVLVTATTLSF